MSFLELRYRTSVLPRNHAFSLGLLEIVSGTSLGQEKEKMWNIHQTPVGSYSQPLWRRRSNVVYMPCRALSPIQV